MHKKTTLQARSKEENGTPERIVANPFFIEPAVIFDPHHPDYGSQITRIANAIADLVTKRRRAHTNAARLSPKSRQQKAKR
ncbi:hypothetical protein [Nitrolancea hollandica]|uniref:Uncharacterized protein n=1 Tax=Nitrolancea hollandica Lb TaxID=1129897 RepID=I4ELB2_9BACT|nr:hypothetical protein [Nitrolancea hollandica]CCF85474.1 hypothetical protein NITHO_500009 [Nitrolancea hollandica Lb]